MKLVLGMVLLSVSFTGLASVTLNDSQPLSLKLSDNSVKDVMNCDDVMKIREQGLTISEIVNLPDRFATEMKSKLVQCYLENYSNKKGWREIEHDVSPVNIKDFINYFPASESIAISNSDIKALDENFKGKTISQKEKSVKYTLPNKAVSSESGDGYIISDSRAFKDGDGKTIRYVTVNKFLNAGTWSESNTYEIISRKEIPWEVKEITINSPL